MNKLGKMVADKRKELVLTQVQFAKKLRISHVSLIKIESGELIGTKITNKLAKYFRMQPSEIRRLSQEKIEEE